MEKGHALILERQNVQTRLQDLFTSLNRASSEPALYTQLFPKERRESLILTFDNGVDPEPSFSGTLIGRLYLDEKNDLCLALWPMGNSKELSWRNEVLLSNVVDFSIQFLGEKKEANPKIQSISPHAGWHPNWPKERGDLPSLIRLTVHQKEESLKFAFQLPVSEPVATYWQKGFKS